ncbi:MAG: efflux RND transporter periplasmic adaptor subunit [Armatimonadetes bacterium]|nr:efflux RND transporter periplasmic adaptor subunit [Armatimonadota bacterium]
MKRNLWLLVILPVCIAVIAATSGFWKWGKKNPLETVPTAHVQKGNFEIPVRELGKLKAEKSVTISARIPGKIIRLCKEGAEVKPGDFLIQIDTSDMVRTLQERELDHQNALNEVLKTKGELDSLRLENELKIKQTRAELDHNKGLLQETEETKARYERLLKDRLVTQAQCDEIRLKVEEKKLSVRKSELSLSVEKRKALSSEKNKSGQIENLNIRSRIQKVRLDEVRTQIREATIKAPAAGIVIFKEIWKGGEQGKITEGDQIFPQFALIEIPDLTKMNVAVKVDEMSIHLVKAGQPARIKLDADPTRLLLGKVTEIATLASEGRFWERTAPGKKYVEVVIGLEKSDPKLLKPGMSANVDIITRTIPDVLSIPLEAVITEGKQAFVYLRTSSGFEKRAVALGDKNDNFVVVKKGISKGDSVALKDPTRKTAETPSPTPLPEGPQKK